MAPTDRSELSSRILPQMTPVSPVNAALTAPAPPLPSTASVAERVAARFAITGNAVITGGAGTLALHTARALLEHGASGLALLDLDPINQSGPQIQKLSPDFPQSKVTAVKCNVTSSELMAKAMGEASQFFSSQGLGQQIDVLLTFAGVVGCVHASEMPEKEWRRVMDINLTGSFLAAQAVLPYMSGAPAKSPHQSSDGLNGFTSTNTSSSSVTGRGGAITFIASMSGHMVNFPQPQSAYNVSKAGVVHLARCLAAEWAHAGIRVNSVSPGYMDTVLNEGEGLEIARSMWNDRCPLGRMGSPDELAGVCILLSSKRAGGYITGSDFGVDGGTRVF